MSDPDLCRKVAEAISGAETVHPEGTFSPALPVPFLPDTDLNHAFDAAERVGEEVVVRILANGATMVEIRPTGFELIAVQDKNLALAICHAILAMKGQP